MNFSANSTLLKSAQKTLGIIFICFFAKALCGCDLSAGKVTFSIKSCFSSHLANFFANFSLAFILTFRLLIPSDIR